MTTAEDVLEMELEMSDNVMGQEQSVRERCQHVGISLENVRYRVGSDRFKWLALLAFLKLKTDVNLFDDMAINDFFEYIFPHIKHVEHKNPLASVLVYYITLQVDTTSKQIKFELDRSKLNYIQKDLFPQYELMFQQAGLKPADLVRYIRLFQSTFSP